MYIGNTPAESYASFLTETFSVSATASYTLSHAVSNENDIRLVINGVVQQPGSGKAYTASGTTLTLTSATVSGDVMYAVYLGRALQTVNPPNASVGSAQIADSLISGKTALGATPADTDELLISDAGTLKRVDYSHLKAANTAEFLAYRGGSTQTGIADNVTTKLEFNTESFDPDSVFDNSTNYRFVAPSAGKYMLYTNIHIYDSSTSIQTFTLKFYKNGSKYSQTYFLSSSDDPLKYAFLSLTQVADLSASDYIEVYAQVNTVDGGSTNLEHESGIMQNYFGGYKLIT